MRTMHAREGPCARGQATNFKPFTAYGLTYATLRSLLLTGDWAIVAQASGLTQRAARTVELTVRSRR
eukprot:2653928-Prymnesium_polylepis.3